MKLHYLFALPALAFAIATSLVAQDRISRDCRREVVQLCGIKREAIPSCLIQKHQELTRACRAQLRERVVKAQGERPQVTAASITRGQPVRELAYGSDPLQTLEYYGNREPGAAAAPLIINVHGGGWKRGDKSNATGKAKAPHYQNQGYAFATINYRLVPEATVEQQAADVAAAIAFLIKQAARLGHDPSRIVLTGHSAGAHLVALVGTDPQYLRAVGLELSAIRGVIPNDGAAYDVPAQMRDGPKMMQQTYAQAFGSDPARQRSLSPTLHAQAPNAPAFLIIHVQREDGVRQSNALATALRAAGTTVQIHGFPGQGLAGHMAINRRLGEADYPATPVVDQWLKQVFN